MVRVPGEGIRGFHGAFRVMAMHPVCIFVGKSMDTLKIASLSGCLQQLQKRVFSLSAHRHIDVGSIKGCFRIIGGKIPAPYNRNSRIPLPDFPAAFHRAHGLRARHHGHRQELNVLFADQRQERRRRGWVKVAVNDGVLLATFEYRRHRQNGKWKPPAAIFRCLRIVENNHVQLGAVSGPIILASTLGLGSLTRFFNVRFNQTSTGNLYTS